MSEKFLIFNELDEKDNRIKSTHGVL